jgi:hypothetical protein
MGETSACALQTRDATLRVAKPPRFGQMWDDALSVIFISASPDPAGLSLDYMFVIAATA